MSSYHLLTKRAYANPYGGLGAGNNSPMMRGFGQSTGQPFDYQRAAGTGGYSNHSGALANPYGNISPTPSMGAPEWQSAPGLRTPAVPGLGSAIWRNKGEIAGNLAGWKGGAMAGAAGGAALGSVVPIVGTAVGGFVGGVVGGLAGGWGGGKLGEMGDNHLNAQADSAAAANSRVYRPPVTDMSSYGANMLAQGIEQNRARPGLPT